LFEFAAVMQVFVHSVSSGEDDPVQQYDVADLQFVDIGISQRRCDTHDIAGWQFEIGEGSLLLKFVRILIEPIHHAAGGVQDDSAASISPAHIRYRDEERGRQTVQLADLAAADSELT